MKFAIISPPMKKQQVATSDGHCKLAIPEISDHWYSRLRNVNRNRLKSRNNNHNKSFEG
jgi:hypothetical protein